MAGNGGADVGQQLFVVPGLLDEVFSTGAHCFNDVVDGAVGGDHDDRKLRLALLDLRQQLEAALAGEGEIEENKIKTFLVENAQSLFAVGGHVYRIALQREQHFKRFTDAGLVVDDQYARGKAGVAGVAVCGGRRDGQIHGLFNFRHVLTSLTRETPDERLCRRLLRSRHEFCPRVPE